MGRNCRIAAQDAGTIGVMQNIVILAGNIGQTPEVRTTQGGTKITNFSLATSRPRLSEGRVLRDENGYRVMDTEWHRITCFNGLGKTVAEHCEKGMKVLVHGRIHYTKWIDSMGNDRYGCEIIAEKVDFLSRPKSAEMDPNRPAWIDAASRGRMPPSSGRVLASHGAGD
jgi:single-strand DNA-binding protein